MINSADKKSNRWLFLILFITVALTVWTASNNDSSDSEDETDLLAPTAEKNSKKIGSQNTDIDLTPNVPSISDNKLIPWDKLARKQRDFHAPKDLFKPHSWVVIPPAPKVKPAPPPPPVAPPSPFTYFGKLENGPKGTLLFLIANNKVYSAKQGEKIDAFWRYDNDDVNNIYMTYLPLNLPQVLSKSQKASAPLQANVPATLNYEGN